MRLQLKRPADSVVSACFTGKPKATLRQPGFASDYSISKKPNPALLRDKGSTLGVKADVDMPPYPDIPVQRHVSMSPNSRYLGFI